VVPPRGTCVWGCGRTNFNVEHIISRQVAKRIGIEYPVPTHLGEGVGRTEIELKDRVCTACNAGFSRRFDERMIEFMGGPIKDGTRVTLTNGRQGRLGRWAIKTALLLQVWMEDLRELHPQLGLMRSHAPAEHFRKLRAGHPAQDTRVWIGAFNHPQAPPMASFSGGIPLPEATVSGIELLADRGYQVWFTLCSVVFFVVGWDDGHKDAVADDALDGAKNFPGKLHQIWPATAERIEWPPNSGLSTHQLADLFKTYPDWVQPK
jgi:hypothetical protein